VPVISYREALNHIALIAAVCVGAITIFGAKTSEKFSSIASQFP